jgi:hypothetical protein
MARGSSDTSRAARIRRLQLSTRTRTRLSTPRTPAATCRRPSRPPTSRPTGCAGAGPAAGGLRGPLPSGSWLVGRHPRARPTVPPPQTAYMNHVLQHLAEQGVSADDLRRCLQVSPATRTFSARVVRLASAACRLRGVRRPQRPCRAAAQGRCACSQRRPCVGRPCAATARAAPPPQAIPWTPGMAELLTAIRDSGACLGSPPHALIALVLRALPTGPPTPCRQGPHRTSHACPARAPAPLLGPPCPRTCRPAPPCP